MANKANSNKDNAPTEYTGSTKDTASSSPAEANKTAGVSSSPAENGMKSKLAKDSSTATPIDSPPFESQGSDNAFGAAVWHENKKITGLWSKNETRNSWAAIDGLGWKKINGADDTSCTALTMLAAHAQAYNKNVKLQLDNEQINEMYVW